MIASDNWRLLCYEFTKDHCQCDLIWNHKTREELREALEQEMRLLTMDAEVASSSANVRLAWNFREFEVSKWCIC